MQLCISAEQGDWHHKLLIAPARLFQIGGSAGDQRCQARISATGERVMVVIAGLLPHSHRRSVMRDGVRHVRRRRRRFGVDGDVDMTVGHQTSGRRAMGDEHGSCKKRQCVRKLLPDESGFRPGGPPLHPVGTAEEAKCSADHGAADMRSDRFCHQSAEVTGDEQHARIVFLQDWLAQHAK